MYPGRFHKHLEEICLNLVMLKCRGCVLAFGVIVGTGVELPEYTRLSRISKKSKVRNYDATVKKSYLFSNDGSKGVERFK